MGFFHDGHNNDMGDLFEQLPKLLFRGGKALINILKPGIRNIQQARQQIAMHQATQAMPQQVRSQDSPTESPAMRPPLVAAANLSEPPLRR